MDITIMQIGGILLFLVGLALFLSGFMKNAIPGNPIKTPLAAWIIGGLVMVVAIAGTGLTDLFEAEQGQTIIYQDGGTGGGADTTQYPSFDITPSAVTTSGTYNEDTTLNTAKTMFTIPARANTTANTIIHLDNATAWADPRLQFIVVPVPWAGATADHLATIFFDVSNYDARVEADDDNYRLITKSSGEYQVIWTEGSNTWYVDGSKTMLMTGNATITLDFDVNQGGFARMDINDPIDMTVTFHNEDWSWSKAYTASFEVQIQHT
jgi:hypothetical protein